MLHPTEAIILHSIKYGDNSLIVHAYTEFFGRQAYLVRGVYARKSKFHVSFFQPLTLLDLQVKVKESRDLQYLQDLKLNTPHYQLNSSVVKSSIALFLGEILYRVLVENEPNKDLFIYLKSAIQVLDISESGVANFHLIFLLQFTRFLGIYPKNHSELDLYQPPKSKVLLLDLINSSLNDLKHLQIDSNSRKLLLESVVKFYRNHIEGFPTINSLGILQDVFA